MKLPEAEWRRKLLLYFPYLSNILGAKSFQHVYQSLILDFFFFGCILFLKSFLNLLQYHFCFMLWILGHKACGILSPLPGIKPASLALEHKVSTTQLPGKFPRFFLYAYNIIKSLSFFGYFI